MQIRLGGMNHHKLMKYLRVKFPERIFNIEDYDPFYIGDAIADGTYNSSLGVIEVKGGFIYKDGRIETNQVVGVRDPNSPKMPTFFYRIIKTEDQGLLVKATEYDELINLLELVPV